MQEGLALFFKQANAESLGLWQGEADGVIGHSRVASHSKTSSYFLQNAGKIDVEAALRDVSDLYAISDRAKDYIFIPVRANSVDVPNENGDCFTKTETLRYDSYLARRVFQSYLMKPHHINHRADNPRMARGFIVDVHYNDANAMPDKWRQKYEASTGVPQERDIFIEALIAVDASKDPFLAKGYRADTIRTFSMGCDCQSTRCSICGHRAASKSEFCTHIRGGNKLRWFPSPRLGGKRILAYEECEFVVYGELSAVDEPADPRADKEGPAFSLHASREASSEEVREYLRSRSDIPLHIKRALLRGHLP